jgi:hypothetical protein
VQARRLLPDGTYERLSPVSGEEPVNSQAILCDEGPRAWHFED